MKKLLAIIVISFSLAVLEADNKPLLREPHPIVFQMDLPQGDYMRQKLMLKYLVNSFQLN